VKEEKKEGRKKVEERKEGRKKEQHSCMKTATKSKRFEYPNVLYP
jgi:hypothetical protein